MEERLEQGSAKVHPARDVLQSIAQAPTWAVLWLVGVSMGLGLVGAQVGTLWVLVLFSIVWGVTVLAMLGWVARWFVQHEGGGRHRRMAH
ncbi:hypothetical protein [Kitasatospora sp. GAS204B]|uniref:hypothetical protein n=1 Tax=unclassified Kitasatospora TaxID=2633591 RepID=UPI002475CD10|nr:hypothetical protein [Kitasatospora sp. GAS204B]MDH6120352.1 hypothetical protein [Kitasatospora sp. GAS204B]